jgi:hypothetical protein
MDRYGHLFPTHSEDIKKKMQAVWDGSADNGNVRRLHS